MKYIDMIYKLYWWLKS